MTFGYCGDTKVDSGKEVCDGNNLNGQNCNTQGFDGGALKCNNCNFDTSDCYKCGDGKINPGEQCDGNNLGGKTCQSLGYTSGRLNCNNQCEYDESKCATCGNNVCEQGETYVNCIQDCPAPVVCGNNKCETDENCENCIKDCGCNGGENCVKGECKLDIKTLETGIREGIKEDVKKELDKKEGGKLKTIYYIIGIAVALITGIVRIFFWKKSKRTSKERRRLAAIMFTDMKGFSSEIGKDEEGTIKKLGKYEKVMRDVIKKHDGRVVKTIGDSIMGDFESSVNAVKCAKEIQKELSAGDILIRIGIHVGDVIEKDGDLLGDAVNIASRIEGICEPGEIYISEAVYSQVKGKIDYRFKNLGLKELKHIAGKVKVYMVG